MDSKTAFPIQNCELSSIHNVCTEKADIIFILKEICFMQFL